MPGDGGPSSLGGARVDSGDAMQTVSRASIRKRHRVAFYTFIAMVIVPFALILGYLEIFAQDQFSSEAGFSVRKEEGASSVNSIGGLAQLTGAASTDAEILYDFIRSQDLVQRVDGELNLMAIYGKNHLQDPLYTLAENSTIEEKQDYWRRMVTVEYNEATGLIRLEVRAFSPTEAQLVAQAIIRYSSEMINRLSEAAREDATRYARDELARAVDRLKDVREAITEYRSRTQVVDPLIDIQGQVGLLNTLQGQLAEALIDLDMLNDIASAGDPRTAQAERRIEVIQRRLEEERRKFGVGGSSAEGGPNDYASIVAEYERLVVDRQVAEEIFPVGNIDP